MSNTGWLWKQWESLEVHQSEILQYLIRDTIKALKRLEKLEQEQEESGKSHQELRPAPTPE